MDELPADLAELAHAYDIATEFWDWRGQQVTVATASVSAVLAALGVDASDPPAALGARRAWGLAAQLYSVRSRDSWGVGDLADLADLATWAAVAHDAGYVLINPLHAAAPVAPMEPSPYLPVTRRFANPLYLR